jgi:hypothetical protein
MTPPEATNVVFVRTKKGKYSAGIDNAKFIRGHNSFEIVTTDTLFHGRYFFL